MKTTKRRSIRSKQIERAEKIAEEEMYDGFYAVITILDDNVDQILRINKQHWEILETFGIMKSEFEARPVYVQRGRQNKGTLLNLLH